MVGLFGCMFNVGVRNCRFDQVVCHLEGYYEYSQCCCNRISLNLRKLT